MQKKSSISFLVAVLALAGCDNGNGNDHDAGTQDSGTSNPDGGTTNHDSGTTDQDSGATSQDSGTSPDGGTDPDGGTAGCGARVVALTMGDQTITGDTSGMSSGLAVCNGGASPEEVIAVTLPGTGLEAVSFTLVTDGTPADFDTVVEVRTTCDSTVGLHCFDEAGPDESRSNGKFSGEGGSTVYLVVTGYSGSDSGAWSMDVNVTEATPPTLTGGTVYRVGGESPRYDFLVDGGDAGGDAAGIRVTLLDASGAEIGFDFDEDPSTPDTTELTTGFRASVSGQTTFTAALARITPDYDYFLDVVDASSAATQARVTVHDRYYAPSASMVLDIHDVTETARGGACSADVICTDGYACVSDVCGIPAATTTACAAATELTLAADTPATTTGTLSPGVGHAIGTCANTFGPENLYTVTVPAGAFDLIASTDNAASGDADTVVYIDTECGAPDSEVTCSDDANDVNYLSTAVVEDVDAGTYTIAVEIYGGPDEATSYQLDVRLRPVLDAGAACDPNEIDDRCSTASCPTTGEAVCPPAA